MLFVDNKKKAGELADLPPITIGDNILTYVENYCYLGVKLDTAVNFHAHFQKLMSTLNHKVILLCKIRSFIDVKTAIIIYKAHLLSMLEYCSIFIDGIPVNLLCKLQRVQNKCLRICHLADKKITNVNLHIMSKILPLRLRRKQTICKFMF